MALQLWDDFEDEFMLFGISSSRLDEIKFIYNINKYFSVKFKREADFDMHLEQGVFGHSLFSYTMDPDLSPFYIIKNLSHPNQGKGNEASLFPDLGSERYILRKHKHFDYLLKIPYHLAPEELNPLPLDTAPFVTNYSHITDLTTKENKLFFI